MRSQRAGHSEGLLLHFIPLVKQSAITVSESSNTVTKLFLRKWVTLLRSQKNNTILTFEGKTMTKCGLIHPIHIYIYFIYIYIYIYIYIHTHVYLNTHTSTKLRVFVIGQRYFKKYTFLAEKKKKMPWEHMTRHDGLEQENIGSEV